MHNSVIPQKSPSNVYFKRVNFMVCELYLIYKKEGKERKREREQKKKRKKRKGGEKERDRSHTAWV